MQESNRSTVAHAFDDHAKCGNWCKFQDDPKNYHHQNLPGSHDLKGEGLKIFLEESLEHFSNDNYIKKLMNLGSTQRNESLNIIIGYKNPKICHHGASESSDFRTAAILLQFNDGYDYLLEVRP